MLKRIGRYLLKRLEIPLPSYEERIINNMQNLYREIQPGDVLLVEGRSKLSRIIQTNHLNDLRKFRIVVSFIRETIA